MKNNNTKEENRKGKNVGEKDSIAYIVSFFFGIYILHAKVCSTSHHGHFHRTIHARSYSYARILATDVPRIVLHICRPPFEIGDDRETGRPSAPRAHFCLGLSILLNDNDNDSHNGSHIIQLLIVVSSAFSNLFARNLSFKSQSPSQQHQRTLLLMFLFVIGPTVVCEHNGELRTNCTVILYASCDGERRNSNIIFWVIQ